MTTQWKRERTIDHCGKPVHSRLSAGIREIRCDCGGTVGDDVATVVFTLDRHLRARLEAQRATVEG